jgi:CRP-like cAMP-binding protein
VIKLLRLLRIARVYRYVHKLQEAMVLISTAALRLLGVLVMILLFAHWNACFQYLLATFEAEEVVVAVQTAGGGAVNATALRFHPQSWVHRMEADGMIRETNAWAWAFFTAVSQMLAISTGVKPPVRDVELWGYLASVLLGAMFYGFFVASLTALIAEADASAKAYTSKLDMVNQYMRHSRLPRALRSKLRAYYELLYPSKRSFDEFRILSEVSKPLRQEIAMHKTQRVLDGLLRTSVGGPEAQRIAGKIAQRLERVVFVAGDTVIQEGEEAEGMFFVSSGAVTVVSATGETLTTLGQGAFFGEMSLLHPEGRSVATIRVDTYCEGYHLSKRHYRELEAAHPTIRGYLESVAKLRLKRQAAARGGASRPSIDHADVHSLFDTLRLGEKRTDVLKREIKSKRESIRKATLVASHGPPPGVLKRQGTGALQRLAPPHMLKRQASNMLGMLSADARGRQGAADPAGGGGGGGGGGLSAAIAQKGKSVKRAVWANYLHARPGGRGSRASRSASPTGICDDHSAQAAEKLSRTKLHSLASV